MLQQHQAAEEEIQSGSDCSGSSVTQYPEAELAEDRVFVPYLDAKVTPPQVVELAVPTEPITVQASDTKHLNGRRFAKPPRVATPVFGIGTRASFGATTPRQFASDSEDSSFKVTREQFMPVVEAVSPWGGVNHSASSASRQRVGSPDAQQNLANALILPMLSRAERTKLWWCLSSWHGAMVLQKLQRHMVESAQLLREQGAHVREVYQQRQQTQAELAKVTRALQVSEKACENLELEEANLATSQFGGEEMVEMLTEMAMLRDALEFTQISEEENSQAECAVLRSLREEIALQRQHDRAAFQGELQRERESCQELREALQRSSNSASFGDEVPLSVARSPRPSLRTIVASHSHPKSEEVARTLAEEVRMAESQCNRLADEMHVQDIMLRRVRLDEQQLMDQLHSQAEAAEASQAQRLQLHAEMKASEHQHATAASQLTAQMEESHSRMKTWAFNMANKLELNHAKQLLSACAHAWWLEVHRSRMVHLSSAEDKQQDSALPAAGAAAEALRRAEARCEISRLRSQALEAELEAALQDQEQESDASDGAEDSMPSRCIPQVDPVQTVRMRQLSRWAFDGLFLLMRCSFLAWRDQRAHRQALVKAWSSNCNLLSFSLVMLCTRALFSVWLQATLASKGRLHFQSRPLRPGILRGANRRTQGALQLLERVWLLRFVLTLWSAVLAPGHRED